MSGSVSITKVDAILWPWRVVQPRKSFAQSSIPNSTNQLLMTTFFMWFYSIVKLFLKFSLIIFCSYLLFKILFIELKNCFSLKYFQHFICEYVIITNIIFIIYSLIILTNYLINEEEVMKFIMYLNLLL